MHKSTVMMMEEMRIQRPSNNGTNALHSISDAPTEELPSDAGAMDSGLVIGVVALLLWVRIPGKKGTS